MIKTHSVIVLSLVLLLCNAVVAADNGCINCHSSEAFFARFPKLYNYYQEWKVSPHALSGVTCDDCHGGEPSAETLQEAHVGMFPVHNEQSSLYFSAQPATCGQCHREKQRAFEQSKHFRALENQSKVAPTCTTCHPAMNKRPAYHAIVLDACTACHKRGNSQGLPDIVDAAENLFGHVNAAHGMLGWARLHYSSQNWPGDSREQLRQLEQRYAGIVDQIHRFDLAQSDAAAMELLSALTVLFQAERQGSGGSAPAPEPGESTGNGH